MRAIVHQVLLAGSVEDSDLEPGSTQVSGDPDLFPVASLEQLEELAWVLGIQSPPKGQPQVSLAAVTEQARAKMVSSPVASVSFVGFVDQISHTGLLVADNSCHDFDGKKNGGALDQQRTTWSCH